MSTESSEYLPFVSTVITSYNKGRYLAETIESALRQTYVAHEVIVIDDGSTDNTAQVAREFGSRIRYYAQTNKGQCNAKNRGVAESRGEFVAFLDGDDLWRPTKLEKQVALLSKRPEVALVYTDRLKFRDGDGSVVWASNRVKHRLYRGRVLDEVLVDNFIPFSSVLVRKSCFVAVGGFDEDVPVAPDYDLWLRLARSYEVDFVDEVLMEYRLCEGSIGSRIGNKFDHVMRIQQRFVDRYFGGKYPKPHVIAAAMSRRYASRGNYFLSRGERRNALSAYWTSLRWQPFQLRRYMSVVRSVTPEVIVSLLKRTATASSELRSDL